MIAVEFFVSKQGSLLGFHIRGHAESALSGDDLVCASVSSAAYMTANTITEILRLNAAVMVDEEGEMLVRLQERDQKAGRDILSGFKLHMLALEEQYPRNIHVNYTEV